MTLAVCKAKPGLVISSLQGSLPAGNRSETRFGVHLPPSVQFSNTTTWLCILKYPWRPSDGNNPRYEMKAFHLALLIKNPPKSFVVRTWSVQNGTNVKKCRHEVWYITSTQGSRSLLHPLLFTSTRITFEVPLSPDEC